MKKIRNGFSMIELLFVMVIVAALITIAVPVFNSANKAEAITSMKSDMRNYINVMVNYKMYNDNYAELDIPDLRDQSGDGFVDDGSSDILINENKLPISKKNWVEMYGKDCVNSGDQQGFYIRVYNKEYRDENGDYPVVYFNSCTDSYMHM